MNRQLRRIAARQKPLPEPRRVPIPKILDEYDVFTDVERLLDKIELGEMETVNGNFVMQYKDGEWYEVVPALNGWISAWKMFDQKFRLNHDVAPLVRLCNQLNYSSPITLKQLQEARATVMEERRLFRQIPRDDLASAAKTKQIALYMGAD